MTRRSTWVIALVVATTLGGSACAASIALRAGWHPKPSTRMGCWLHKHFHDGSVELDAAQMVARGQSIIVTLGKREHVVSDRSRTASLQGWLNARRTGWAENLLTSLGSPTARVRGCQQDPENERTVYLTEDWLAVTRSKNLSRPICREEWRELEALLETR